MGRFISPDWSAQEDPVPYANLEDPQSLNLYTYVRNNPLTRIDADGHDDDDADPQQAVQMTPAEAKQASAMAYSENTRATVTEDEAYISTAVNRVTSGDKSYLNGSGGDLNLTNVINAPNQYQGVGGTNFNNALNGTTATPNATQAAENVQKNGVTTNGTFPWTKIDKNGKPVPPTAAQQKRMCGKCVAATPAQVGNIYLFKPAPPPPPAPKLKHRPQPHPKPKRKEQ